MPPTPEPDAVTVTIAAEPDAVWALVSDIRNMGRWSPETRRCFWLGRRRGAGARFVGVNRDRGWVWPTIVRVEESEPGRVFAFRNTVGDVGWRYEFHAVEGGGTRLVERRDISSMRTGLVRAFYRPMGGYDSRTRTVLAGMQRTVERIKAAAEA